MKLAATPIRTIESTRPNTRAAGWSRAAPATARTLSSDMEMSAITICQAACANVLRLTWPSPVASIALASLWPGLLSSRHIFQQTHSSRMPPARSRPTISSSSTAMLAKAIRNTVAATMPTKIARERCSAGRPAAARPITIALSPASTKSIMMTWMRVAIAPCENISRSIIRSAPRRGKPRIFDDGLDFAEYGRSAADKRKCLGQIPGGRQKQPGLTRVQAGHQGQAARGRERTNAESRQHDRARQRDEQRSQRNCHARDERHDGKAVAIRDLAVGILGGACSAHWALLRIQSVRHRSHMAARGARSDHQLNGP